MTGRLVPLGLFALVVAGVGCNALAPPVRNSPSPTVTAAPVPSTPSPTTPDLLPPGVEQTGVANHRRLVSVHRTRLLNTNYTRTVTESTRWQNGTLRWQRTRVTRTNTDSNRVFVVLDQSGTPMLRDVPLDATHVELYARLQHAPAGPVVSAALTDGGQTDYRTDYSRRYLVNNGRDLALLLSVFETRIVSRDHRDERTVFRVESIGSPVISPRFVPIQRGISDPDNVTFELLVDERGIVHQYYLAYTVTVEGRELRYERRVHLSAIGTTTVSPPAWLDRVNTTATPTVTGDADS